MKVLLKRCHLIGHSIKILSAHRRPQIHYAQERMSSCYASLIFVAKFVVVVVFFQPRNIFLQGHRHETGGQPTIFQVKIGDFGLARKEVVVSPGGSSPLVSLIEPLTPLFQPGRKIFQLT